MASIDVGIHPDPARITADRLRGYGCPEFSVIRLTGRDAQVVVYISERPVLDALQAALDTIRADMKASEAAAAAAPEAVA